VQDGRINRCRISKISFVFIRRLQVKMKEDIFLENYKMSVLKQETMRERKRERMMIAFFNKQNH
jgi:hypothetical protein